MLTVSGLAVPVLLEGNSLRERLPAVNAAFSGQEGGAPALPRGRARPRTPPHPDAQTERVAEEEVELAAAPLSRVLMVGFAVPRLS